MREIIFRGKRVDNGEWVYGDLLHDGYDYDVAIWERETKMVTEVVGSTVGQFTGLTANGKRIFEGDVVTFETTAYSFKPCVVAFSFTKMRFIVRWREANYPMDIDFKYEVIGNIYDNPELFGVM